MEITERLQRRFRNEKNVGEIPGNFVLRGPQNIKQNSALTHNYLNPKWNDNIPMSWIRDSPPQLRCTMYVLEACNYVPQPKGRRNPDSVDTGVASCLHYFVNGWILTKLTWIHVWEGGKEWLDFCDLDPISKVTKDMRMSNFNQNQSPKPVDGFR